MNLDSKDNDEVKRHLLNIEARLDRLSVSPQLSFDSLSARRGDEIDLREIWNILWDGKWWIIGITFLFAVAGVLYALSLPNVYQSSAKLAPADGGGAGRLAGLGGLASMAGISLGGEGDKTQFAVELISSRVVVKDLMEKYDLKPKVLAVLNWDKNSAELTYNADLYNQKSNSWVRVVEPPLRAEPSFEEFYEAFRADLEVVVDKKTGFISVSYVHQSPLIAQEIVTGIIQLVNERMRQRDIEKAQASITYLEEQLNETALAEVKVALFELIEEQIKTKMLANVLKQYALQEIDPPYLPEKRYAPSRSIICIVFALIGGFLSVCFVIVREIIKRV